MIQRYLDNLFLNKNGFFLRIAGKMVFAMTYYLTVLF